VVECSKELVNRVGSKRISHLWPVERYSNDTKLNMAVIGDVGEFTQFSDGLPLTDVTELRGTICHGSSLRALGR
jgi:hypothetical protein